MYYTISAVFSLNSKGGGRVERQCYNVRVMKKIMAIAFGGIVFLVSAQGAVAAPKAPVGPTQREVFKAQLAHVTGGTVGAVGSNTLTVSHEGESITVNILPTTKLRRKFWGNAALTEISVGDKINVWGSFKDEAQTIIDARMVRDTSIQKRNGVFIGEVVRLTDDGWIIKTPARGEQTVKLVSTTKFTNIAGRTIKDEDILIGHRVRVRGIWDRKLTTVSEVTTVKDYSLSNVPKSAEKISSKSGETQ